MSSSNSPCAACKFLRRKCTQECVFAPYFPPDQPQRFSNVHKVFGASNVAKLLQELDAAQREDAVNSLAYEAEARLRDPVYGCVGLISLLQQRLKQVQTDLYSAKKELATYIGPTALMPMIQPGYANPGPSSGVNLMQQQYHMGPMMGIPTGVAAAGPGPSHGGALMIREPQPQPQPQQQHQHQQQQLIEVQQQQQLAALAVRDEQELLRNWELQQQHQQQQQQQFMRYSGGGGGYEGALVIAGGSGGGGFNQAGPSSGAVSPSLALGAATYDPNPYAQIQPQQPPPQQQPPQDDQSLGQLLLLQQPVTPQQQQQEQLELGQGGIPHHEQLPQQHLHPLLQSQHHHFHQQPIEHNPQQQQQQQPQQPGIDEGRTLGPTL